MDDKVTRRSLLNRISLGLSGLIGVVLSIPVLSYLFTPLVRPPDQQWLDVDAASTFKVGDTVLKSIPEVSPLPWAGQLSQVGIWVRRDSNDQFTVFEVNCAHLGCPVRWKQEAGLFLCPCHGGVYYKDGTVAGGPPPRPLFQYATRVQNGRLQVLSRGLGIST
jgi:menaquinol-cytochrome c reductase iron-sulfur subunit